MSIQVVGPDDVEQFTLKLNPARTFSSSSLLGITGSVFLFARHSSIEKEVQPLSAFLDAEFNDHDLQRALDGAAQAAKGGATDISQQMAAYMTGVNAQGASPRKLKQLEIIRFEPSFQMTLDTMRKDLVINSLMPYYRNVYPTGHYAYTNYHCLNFFTASSVPSDTVLLYANSASNVDASAVSGSYVVKGPFTLEFYINPRYTTDSPGDQFKAGTLLHLSSSYAVSIVSGSQIDKTDRVAGFRVVLQLSHSADVLPSTINLTTPSSGAGRRDLIFVSDDNSLLKNHWHHVAIRWGTNAVNAGTGSFIIDGVERGRFIVPSSTIAPAPYSSQGNPDVLCVGNFYEGNNLGTSAQVFFFNQNIAQREGLTQLVNDGNISTNTPASFKFNHPLNAEVHHLRIHDAFLSTQQLLTSSMHGSSETGSLLFYLPPFFTRESPVRKQYGTDAAGNPIGGILQTPFFTVDGSTTDPFNIGLSFGVGGRLINLENFTRDFKTGNYPRLLHLSATQLPGNTEALSADDFLYATGSIRKRNATVLPCDNGLFVPDFGMLRSGTFNDLPASGTVHDKFINDLGVIDLSLITLRELFPTGALFPGLIFESGTMFDSLAGASPENIGIALGDVYTILQRTRDNTSNEVVFFDISNMFYGNRIHPGTLVLQDSAITGTSGKVHITLRDDGFGNVYRADSDTPASTWSSVGNVFYDEGIVVIKSPNIPFFGADQFQVDLQGEQSIHVMRVHSLARSSEVNSSSNPSFIPLSSSLLAHETDDDFVYITGINYHDDNLNVIMKTKLAQPILKKNSNKFLFRSRMDF